MCWKYAMIASVVFAPAVCPFYSVNVVNKADAWIVFHIGTVLVAGSPTVLIAKTHIMPSGVKSARTNFVMIAVSRITTMESFIAWAVEGYCFLESCWRRKP